MASKSNSATSLSASATAASAPSPGVQVHPVAIEAAVPLGKKVRLGEGKAAAAAGKRKKKEKRARSKSKSPTKSRTAANAAADQEATRAERLAANLGELLVDLPTTTSGEAVPAAATAAVDLSEVRRRSSRQESPTTKSPAKSRSRHHKSLSPDKTKAAIR